MRKALLAPVAVSLFFLACSSSMSGQTRAQPFVPSRPVVRRAMSAQSSGAGLGPWAQMAKLTTSGQGFFPGAVSISGDTVVVGHPPGSTNAYVFVKPAGGWKNMVQVAILTPSDEATDFALSVSISGDTIAIGAPGAKIRGAGAVYVYVKPASGWKDMTETAKLTSSGGQSALGNSVSVSGDTIVAGAPGVSAQEAGAALVFVKPAGAWKNMTQTATLESSDIASGDNFGWSVGLSGDTVVAGAPQISTGNGKGYVFVKPANGWRNVTQTAELAPSNGGFMFNFGWAAAIDGNTAVFSQSGGGRSALYVFVRPQSGWRDMNQTAELRAPGTSFWYGYTVAIQGNAIITGDYLFSVPTFIYEGAAFLFLKPKSGWKDSTPDAMLTGSDAHLVSFFGQGVGISGKSVVVTAPENGNGNSFHFGAGYVFIHP